jgi:hypothetical protein
MVKAPRVEIETLSEGTSELDDRSKREIKILPSKFSGMYKIEVAEMN